MTAEVAVHRETSTRVRWVKFSVVGALGIGVQLMALWTLTSLGCNYLLATGIAVETAVLHNFVWHQKFTWLDRCIDDSDLLRRLLRFHLSNGGISIVGNLLLMRLLVGEAGFAVLPANLLSLSACWFANFIASDRWVFVGDQRVNKSEEHCY